MNTRCLRHIVSTLACAAAVAVFPASSRRPAAAADTAEAVEAGALAALERHLATPADRREPVETQPFATVPLSKAGAAAAEKLLVADHRALTRRARQAEMDGKVIEIDGLRMPFTYEVFGEKPPGGRSLFISMHGGGGGPKQLNDGQWRNQQRLYKPAEGVYLAPRAPTDTWDLWHQSHIDRFFDRLIEDMVVFEDVDPDRVYLLGYSAGGDGVYQVAPRMADRFAAASMMAGHPNETSPLGLRNLPFAIHVGERDGAFNRNAVAREWQEQLDALRQADPDGYIHLVKLHAGKGHWMDLEDAEALPWMQRFTRNRHPRKIVWKQDDVVEPRFYWLGVDPDGLPERALVVAEADGQTIRIGECDPGRLTIFLRDDWIDLSRDITVVRGDEVVANATVPRTIATIAATLRERGDPAGASWGRLDVSLDARPPAGYAIVVSEDTQAIPAWVEVVEALRTKHRDHGPVVVTWRKSTAEAVPRLAESRPRFACFVARPEEATREFVVDVHTLCRKLDDDPYGDILWGILTGFDAANALAIAKTSDPLVVRRVTSGTELAMDRVAEGVWYCELEQNRMVTKEAGGEARQAKGPDDTTAALAARLNDGVTDLFVTSGHATERDWQIGFRYRNGSFRSGAGRLWGVDTAGTKIPIDSANPKVWLPIGNCLAGHVDGPDALALAFMNSAGVRQMAGYTVPTWFGYAGWGLLDYFVEQPGRFTMCEAFHANDHALVHRLETKAAPRDARGLVHDRDVVAFYGDPAWEARMAPGKLSFDQTLAEAGGTFTLVITPQDGAASFAPVNTNGSQRGGRPIVQWLPRRIGPAEVVEGAEWKPVVTDDFVLVPLPPVGRADPIRVVFRARAAGR